MRLDMVDSATLQVAAAASGGASLLTASWSMDLFGVSVSVLLAGFAGALVSLSFQPPKTLRGAAVAVAAGTLIAAFSEPIIAHYTGAPPVLHIGIAGLTGALAMSVIPLALKSVPALFDALADRVRGTGGGWGGWRRPPGGGRDES